MKQLSLQHVQKRLKYRKQQKKRDPNWGANQPGVLTYIDDVKRLPPDCLDRMEQHVKRLSRLKEIEIPPAIRGFIRSIVE